MKQERSSHYQSDLTKLEITEDHQDENILRRSFSVRKESEDCLKIEDEEILDLQEIEGNDKNKGKTRWGFASFKNMLFNSKKNENISDTLTEIKSDNSKNSSRKDSVKNPENQINSEENKVDEVKNEDQEQTDKTSQGILENDKTIKKFTEDKPIEDTPTEDKPTKDKPTKDTSTKDTPSEGTHSEDKPSKDTHSEDKPIEENNQVKNNSLEETNNQENDLPSPKINDNQNDSKIQNSSTKSDKSQNNLRKNSEHQKINEIKNTIQKNLELSNLNYHFSIRDRTTVIDKKRKRSSVFLKPKTEIQNIDAIKRMRQQRQNMIEKVKFFNFEDFYNKLRKFEKCLIKQLNKIFNNIKKTLKNSKITVFDYSFVT